MALYSYDADEIGLRLLAGSVVLAVRLPGGPTDGEAAMRRLVAHFGAGDLTTLGGYRVIGVRLDEPAASAHWSVSGWSPCAPAAEPCAGVQTRLVECQEPTGRVHTAHPDCSSASKPASSRACQACASGALVAGRGTGVVAGRDSGSSGSSTAVAIVIGTLGAAVLLLVFIVMAYIVIAYIVMALYSYGPI